MEIDIKNCKDCKEKGEVCQTGSMNVGWRVWCDKCKRSVLSKESEVDAVVSWNFLQEEETSK